MSTADIRSHRDGVSSAADETFGPPAERWAPVGAAASSDDLPSVVVAEPGGSKEYNTCLPPPEGYSAYQNAWGAPSAEILRRLEEDREQLDASLLALTAHFAHVQLRLRQVASCPDQALKDTLLKDLEEFASQGVPDVSALLPQQPQQQHREPPSDHPHSPGQEFAKGCEERDPPPAAAAAAAAAAVAVDEKLRERQRMALEHLRSQLRDLETYAYEVGVADDIPTTTRVEKQNVIIEELQKKLHLSELENFASLSPERLRAIVDAAIAEIVNPAKVKEKVVEQLKTQVTDLERFVQFLQNEIDGLPRSMPCHECAHHSSKSLLQLTDGRDQAGHNCSAARLATSKDSQHKRKRGEKPTPGRDPILGATATNSPGGRTPQEDTKGKGRDRLSLLRRLLVVVQAFIVSELGCGGGGGNMAEDSLDKRQTSLSEKHWGNLRARLEMIVDELVSLLESQRERSKRRLRGATPSAGTLCVNDYLSDEDDSKDEDEDDDDDDEVFVSVKLDQEITRLVRKHLAPALQKLLEHGLQGESAASQSVVMWSFANCFSGRSRRAAEAAALAAEANGSDDRQGLQAWDIIVQYYELKHGREYTDSPACKLSTAYGLSVGDGRPMTSRKALLRAVGDIIASHSPFRRSAGSHFKAFVCQALNEKKLTTWLRLVVKSAVANDRYASDSYVCRAGCDDVLSSLDRLIPYNFNLPVDLAVSRLSGVTDAF